MKRPPPAEQGPEGDEGRATTLREPPALGDAAESNAAEVQKAGYSRGPLTTTKCVSLNLVRHIPVPEKRAKPLFSGKAYITVSKGTVLWLY